MECNYRLFNRRERSGLSRADIAAVARLYMNAERAILVYGTRRSC